MRRKQFYKKSRTGSLLLLAALYSLLVVGCNGPVQITENQYGLKLIETTKAYHESVENKPEHALVDLKELIPSLQISLPYSTANNFVHTILYPPLQTTYLRSKAALALKAVQHSLQSTGLGLKVWDAYRPYTVTEKMWEVVPDSRYAADPAFGSGHNRGISVDLCLINLQTGKELDMGTAFDNFSDTAHIDFTDLSNHILNNRKILQAAMQAHGFVVLSTEWWHFYLPDHKNYPLMNLSFAQIKKIIKTEHPE